MLHVGIYICFLLYKVANLTTDNNIFVLFVLRYREIVLFNKKKLKLNAAEMAKRVMLNL